MIILLYVTCFSHNLATPNITYKENDTKVEYCIDSRYNHLCTQDEFSKYYPN